MDFSNITSTVWSYITWPLSFVSQPIKQPILGAAFGWAIVWIIFHIGYTVLVYLAVLLILSLGAEKFGIVTITIHWKRISELMRGTGVKDSTDGNFSGKVKTIQDFASDNLMFSVGLIFGVIIGMKI